MRMSLRLLVTPVFLLAGGALPGQQPLDGDRPARHVPARVATRLELDHAEALQLYGRAVLLEREHRLIEAVRTYEQALRLDPQSAPLHRALVPLYLALDRAEDALQACQRTRELDPEDYETGLLQARHLRTHDRQAEALAVLEEIVKKAGLKERLDIYAQVCFDLGMLHETASDWAKAEAAFREVVRVLDQPAVLMEQGNFSREEIDIQAGETYERLGRVCLQAKQVERAVGAFEAARKRDPGRAARLSYNLAEVYVEQGKPAEALARLEDYLRTQPQGMDGYELKIKLLRKLNRGGDILPALEAAAGRDPHNLALKLVLGREYRKAGRNADAEKIYLRVIADRPGPEPYRELFALFKEEGPKGAQRALRELEAAMKKAVGKEEKEEEPRDGDPTAAAKVRAMLLVLRTDGELVKQILPVLQQQLLAGGGLSYQTRMAFATLASRLNQLDLAEQLYRSCLDQPGLGETEVYTGLLRVLALSHKYEAVVKICREGLDKAQRTNRVLFHLELAYALMNLNRTEEALESAELAVNEANAGNRLQCRRSRAGLLAQAEKYEEAIAECQALLREYNQPGEVREIRHTLSSIYSAARQPRQSEEQLRLLLEGDPEDATANNDLGYLWADQNVRLEEAERLIRKALELDKRQRTSGTAVGVDSDQDNAAYVDSLGWVLFRRGKLEEARRQLEKASGLPGGDDDPVVWDHLGDVQFRLGRRSQAAQAWKKALELFETGARRRSEEQMREIRGKLRQIEP
jgi:tetratricopeptide (TPR) repeat protein